jgi:hypothetical protein
VNILLGAFEVLIWEEYDLSAGVVLPIFAVVNFALAGALLYTFTRVMTRDYERLPKRPRMFRDIDVPLPGARPAEAPSA